MSGSNGEVIGNKGKGRMSKILPCPFCGIEPEISVEGSHIEIACCVNMSRQKSDYLTIGERASWNTQLHLYSDKVEKKVFDLFLLEWNRRQIT